MRGRMKRSVRKGKRLSAGMIGILLGLFVLAGGATVYGKYIRQETGEPVYAGKSFYFESDLLSDSLTVPDYTMQEGEDEISFVLCNYEDQLRYSEVEIQYQVTLTDAEGAPVKDKAGKAVQDLTGTLANSDAEKKELVFSNLPEGTYTVTATAETPYTKSLRGQFTLQDSDHSIHYSVSNSKGGPLVQMTVTSKDYEGKVRISWPEGAAPNSTDLKLAEIESGYGKGTCDVYFEKNSEYTFQFFKQDLQRVYEKQEFSVEKAED